MEDQPRKIFKVLLLQSRGLGDAIISTSLINSLEKSFDYILVDVWVSKDIAPVFETLSKKRRCHILPLPVIKRQKIKITSFPKLVFQIYKLRKIKYDLCLNVVGDARENLLVSLVGANKTCSVVWAKSHPFRKHIWPGLSFVISENIEIPKNCLNIYSIYEYVAMHLGCSKLAKTGSNDYDLCCETADVARERKCIVIHPLAGNPSREWPFKKWNELIKMILRLDHDVVIVGELSRRDELEKEFIQWRDVQHVSIETPDIANFLKMLCEKSLLVGLDSFSIHAAHSLGVPVVMINGSNDPNIWGPPGVQVLGRGGGCKDYPCYNRPKCIGSEGEYACISTVSVSSVFEAVKNILSLYKVSA